MEAIIGLLIPVTYVLCLILERLFPARQLPKIKGWLLRGVLAFVMSGVINALLPMAVVTALGGRSIFHLAGLGTVAGALVAFVVTDTLSYWLHRLEHNVHFIWRWVHQAHHSAERLDIAGAGYFHPFDITITVLLTTLTAAALGVSPDAAALGGYIGFFYAMFQHLNIRTPRWLGYVIQRPEGHSVHHGRGIHAYNYGNFPLSDLLFGTFRNPADFMPEAGFWDGASARVGAMLIGRDVGQKPVAVLQQSAEAPFTVPSQA
ncbi:MAG TPA: sterol desaturase family protein [Polyangiaceae bacterium]|nr:sterol desaturase family protein [Polyangiaceae bacterium]